MMTTTPILTKSRLRALLARFADLTMLVAGDFFLDKYLFIDPGLSEESLETGLDAYQVVRTRADPGAAGTVAANFRALGMRVTALGFTGDDGHGLELRRGLAGLGVDTDALLTLPNRVTPTYTKPTLAPPDGLLRELNRLDIKNRAPLPPQAEQTLIERLTDLAASVDAVVVLDQVQEAECGVVTTRFREVIADLARARPNLILFADSRERIRHFRGVIIKPNRAEAMQGTPWQSAADVPAEAVSARAQALFKQNGRPVFITLGEAGILLCDTGGVQTIPAQTVTGPTDVVGAGDSVTATIVASLCAGASPTEAAFIGNLAASITIRQIGTTGTATPVDLLDCRLAG